MLELQIILICNSPKKHPLGQVTEESVGEPEEEVPLMQSSYIILVHS